MADFQAGDCIDIDPGQTMEIVIPEMMIRINDRDYTIENYDLETGEVDHSQVSTEDDEVITDDELESLNAFIANYGPTIAVGPANCGECFWRVK